jgi:hypothetical protein
MSSDLLETRFLAMLHRLADVYDGVGHSTGRPYLYFVYDPAQEQAVRRLADEHMSGEPTLAFLRIDVLPLTIQSLAGQEARRQELLSDPVRGEGANVSIVRLWARRLQGIIDERLAAHTSDARPVLVLEGVAALHPLGDPTMLMEELAEHEPRDPRSGKVVPFVILVPGTHPPQASRTYCFLGREDLRLTFYRGEEM